MVITINKCFLRNFHMYTQAWPNCFGPISQNLLDPKYLPRQCQSLQKSLLPPKFVQNLWRRRSFWINGSSSETKHENAQRAKASPLRSTSRRFVSTSLFRRLWLRRLLHFLHHRCSSVSLQILFWIFNFLIKFRSINFFSRNRRSWRYCIC